MSVRVVTDKWCGRCAATRPAADFYAAPSQQTGLSPLCRECSKAANKEYLANLPEDKKAARREREKLRAAKRAQDPAYRQAKRDYYHRTAHRSRELSLKRRYGISLADYDEMLLAQGGTCALCPATRGGPSQEVLHVDHCHVTGKVRGLLCQTCNTTLGKFGDDPARLRRAAEYVEAHQ